MFEPNEAQILKDMEENESSRKSQIRKLENKIRYLRKFEKEITIRLIVYNENGEWRRPTHRHFNVGGKIIGCIDAYSNAEKVAFCHEKLFKNFYYDQETRTKIPIVYETNIKDHFFKNYFNPSAKDKWNPEAALKMISPAQANQNITYFALRKTAEYLSKKCPVCKLISAYEQMGMPSSMLWRRKTVTQFTVNVVDMDAIKLFDMFVMKHGLNPAELTTEQVNMLAEQFSEHHPTYSIFPQIHSLTTSQYDKILNDAIKNKSLLSPTKGINIVFRRGASDKIEISYDLNNINSPIHPNRNVMECIFSNVYDLNKIIIPPSLEQLENASSHIEALSVELGRIYERLREGTAAFSANIAAAKIEAGKSVSPSYPASFTQTSTLPQDEDDTENNTKPYIPQRQFKLLDIALSKLKRTLKDVPKCYGDSTVYSPTSNVCRACIFSEYCTQEFDDMPF